MKRILLVSLVALLAVPAMACGFTDPVAEAGPEALTRSQFIEIYVELRLAEQATPTREAFQARKQQIFERHGAPPHALIEFVEVHGDDVAYMAAVWDTIQHRLEAVETDSAAT